MVEILIIVILAIATGVFAYLYFFGKPAEITGKTNIPNHLAESEIMDKLGESNALRDKLSQQLDEIKNEREVEVSADDKVRQKKYEQKKRIIEEGQKLSPEGENYSIIGYDGADYGRFLGLIIDNSGEKVWVYYKRGNEINLLGGKPMKEIIDNIDKKNKRIFIRYNKNQDLVPKKYEQI